MKNVNVKYWLVSAVNALAGELCIVPFDEKELSFRQKQLGMLRTMCPNEHWCICTNECATTFPEQGVRFSNGKFVKINFQ
jgi:hypothetical protein